MQNITVTTQHQPEFLQFATIEDETTLREHCHPAKARLGFEALNKTVKLAEGSMTAIRHRAGVLVKLWSMDCFGGRIS
jgi:hypothetical protein